MRGLNNGAAAERQWIARLAALTRVLCRPSCYARKSMSAGVGADVEALCSKCGDVWHVVVAKVGEQIVKVQCKQCSGYHRYKSPHGAPAEKKLPATNRPAREREAKAPVERFEKPAVAADLTKPAR